MSTTDAGFAQEYQELVAVLYRTLRPSDGLPDAEIAAAEARLGSALPPPLRAVYALSGAFTALHGEFHCLTPLPELEVENGGLVFYEEAQGVVMWGIRAEELGQCDPPVVQALPTAPGDWRPEHPSLAGFLKMMAYIQAVESGLAHVAIAEIDREVEARLAAEWPLVSDGGGADSGMRLYAREAEVLMVLADAEGIELQAGAKSKRTLSQMRKRLGVDWDEV